MSMIEELKDCGKDSPLDGTRQATGGVNPRPGPEEMLAEMAWRLPGGESLAQFALRGGFLAPQLMARAPRRPR